MEQTAYFLAKRKISPLFMNSVMAVRQAQFECHSIRLFLFSFIFSNVKRLLKFIFFLIAAQVNVCHPHPSSESKETRKKSDEEKIDKIFTTIKELFSITTQ
jgi:hypothetical protein